MSPGPRMVEWSRGRGQVGVEGGGSVHFMKRKERVAITVLKSCRGAEWAGMGMEDALTEPRGWV